MTNEADMSTIYALILTLSLAAYITAGAIRIARDTKRGISENIFRSGPAEKEAGWIFTITLLAAILFR